MDSTTTEIKRRANYTEAEKELLLSLVEKFAPWVLIKMINKPANEAKYKGWTMIAEEYNAVPGVFPSSPKQLHCLFENMRKKRSLRLRQLEKIIANRNSGSMSGIPAMSNLDSAELAENVSNDSSTKNGPNEEEENEDSSNDSNDLDKILEKLSEIGKTVVKVEPPDFEDCVIVTDIQKNSPEHPKETTTAATPSTATTAPTITNTTTSAPIFLIATPVSRNYTISSLPTTIPAPTTNNNSIALASSVSSSLLRASASSGNATKSVKRSAERISADVSYSEQKELKRIMIDQLEMESRHQTEMHSLQMTHKSELYELELKHANEKHELEKALLLSKIKSQKQQLELLSKNLLT